MKCIYKCIDFLKRIKKEYIIIFLVTTFLFMPFLSLNFNEGHDTIFHLTNIDAITKMILNLNFSKITPYLAGNHGYGTMIFYPNFPHIVTGIVNIPFYLLNKGPIYSMKIVYFMIMLLSAYFMYKLVFLLTKNKNKSLLSSIVYINMPYYLCDIYIRGSFNESFIFVFMPMILIGLINLLNNNKKEFYKYFIIGYMGMINSHLVLSVYFTFLVLVFMLFNIKKYVKNIKPLLVSSLIILILIIPDMILLIQHKNLEIYTVFKNEIVSSTSETVKTFGLSIKDFIIPGMNEYDLFKYINIIPIIFMIIGIIKCFKEGKNKSIYMGLLSILVISIILSLKIFPYEYLPKLLLSIQFAYRNMCFIILIVSIFAGIGLGKFKSNYQLPIIYLTTIILCITVSPFINKFYQIRDNYYEDRGVKMGMGAHAEYLTLKGHNNLIYYYNRDDSIKVLNDANSNIKITKNKTPYLEFTVSNIYKEIEIELPRIYYLGYEIKQISSKKTYNIKYNESNNGFIKLKIKRNGKIIVKYKGTTLYNYFKIIRLLFIIIITIYIVKEYIYDRKIKKIKY